MRNISQDDTRITQRSKLLLFILIFITILYPPVFFLIQRGEKAAFQYFAADAFYYLSVVRHSVQAPIYTFDGQFPTNGFHPLWQYGLTLIFSSMRLTTQETQVIVAFYLSILFVAAGTALFGVALLKVTQNVAISFIAAVPGIYYLLFSVIEPQYTNPWAYANGMESPLSILLFGILSYTLIELKLLLQPSKGKLVLLSFLLTLITLSRLDDIFIFIPFLISILIFSNTFKEKFVNGLIASVIPTCVISAYLLYNLSYAGIFLPISGSAKGEIIAAAVNLFRLITSFIPIGQFGDISVHTWKWTTWRALQLYIPILLAFIWVWPRIIPREKWHTFWQNHHEETIVFGFCLYVIAKGTYNLLNVSLMNQGHWYFPLSIMIFNMLSAILITKLVKFDSLSRRVSGGVVIASFLFVLLIANAFENTKTVTEYNAHYFNFWTQRQRITADLKRLSGESKIIEFDDGIISYSLDIPAISGLGFALDKEAFEAKQRGDLLSLAYSRGFNIIASLNYMPLITPEIDNDSGLLREKLADMFFLRLEDLEEWNFSVLYRDPETKTVFIQIEPVEQRVTRFHHND